MIRVNQGLLFLMKVFHSNMSYKHLVDGKRLCSGHDGG